ncbi:hypothetical protein DYGSA30_04200 [Dyella sp. GSA-30]|nr:hypothetical protein DYGSA30_04200 [Dyella sp. GSA-30]
MGLFFMLNFLGGGVYIVWQLVAKEMLFLRPEVVVVQKMLGPLKLGDVKKVQRESITDVVVKEHRFRAKSRDYVKRRVVLETDTGDVELSMRVSSEDGEALRKIILEIS